MTKALEDKIHLGTELVSIGRFAARVSGLASGLALAVRPAGPVEAPGSTARRRRVPRSGMRSTVEAGGTGPDNARRSGSVAVIFIRRSAHSGAERDGLVLLVWRGIGGVTVGTAAAGNGEAVRGSSSRRRASARGARRKLPPSNGETPGDPCRLSPVTRPLYSPRLLAPTRVVGSGRRRGAPKVRP
jgi:hypothetical protein